MVSVRTGSFCSMSSATLKSFQSHMACSDATVAVIGFKSGKTTTQNVRNGPAPSICAASSSSYGTLLTKPTYRKLA